MENSSGARVISDIYFLRKIYPSNLENVSDLWKRDPQSSVGLNIGWLNKLFFLFLFLFFKTNEDDTEQKSEPTVSNMLTSAPSRVK